MGFRDVITPEPVLVEYPTILDEEKPKIKAYTLVSAIAEKYQAMIELDLMNSRMKDFYDIYFLSRNLQFEGNIMQKAIEQTFKRRRTELPQEKPVVFTSEYYSDETKIKQWQAFRNKIEQQALPSTFHPVVDQVKTFLWPVTEASIKGEKFTLEWKPNNGWI